MTTALLSALRPTLEATIQRSRMNGIAVAAARGRGPVEVVSLGTDAAGAPISAESLFPVASVTKLATALVVLRLVDDGVFSLDDPLARHLPEAVAAAHQGVTLRRLLSHTSGLPLDLFSDEVAYGPELNWPALAAACLRTTLQHPPLTRVQYSNVGYGLLAVAAERRMGQPFPTALRSLVLEPLQIEGYLGEQPPRPPALLGGVKGAHASTPLEPFNSPFWRSLAMPWAGLVTTASGALNLARAFLDPPAGFLTPELAAEATRNQVGDLAGGFVPPLIWSRSPWGLGPDLRDEKKPHWAPAPPAVSPDSFGHSGASGCIAWADPSSRVAWAILGTRTADSGWLLRRGPALAEAILRNAE